MASRDEFEALADVADVPENGVLGARKANGERICLVNVGGRITALSDLCSHQDFPLSEGNVLPGGELECVWHGARFDPATGAARQLPARDPVPTYDVRIEDGRVLVGPRRPT
jgi:3-phenylpropionate/trans-cinnamate dioxygenase ferredoxin component